MILAGRVVLLCIWAAPAIGLVACGGDSGSAPVAAGSYVLDRSDYVRALVRARHPEPPAADEEASSAAARRATLEAARKAAGSVQLQLDLAADGTFLVTYRFPRERGRGRGAWTQSGRQLDLRITHDAAGPVESGARVTATIVPEGLRFDGWPVPNAFLLRPK